MVGRSERQINDRWMVPNIADYEKVGRYISQNKEKESEISYQKLKRSL